ncbi:MAG: aminotransferase class V-fold PLP-dependent enzyme [Desulfitobacteriaceae bacterium]
MFKKINYDYLNLVAGVDTQVPLTNGSMVRAINLDNAATTPPLTTVLQAIWDYIPTYGSVHRGGGYKSEVTSRLFEEARQTVLEFVKADPHRYTAIFVKNTTEAINKLSYRLQESGRNQIVLTTLMEHHSNLLPWRARFQTDYINLDNTGRLDLNDLESKLRKYRGAVKLVAITGASNVTGYVNPIHTVAALAHRHGAQILVDGAQLVPHCPVNLKGQRPEQHIDYLAFSAHKLYAPFGTGVIIGPKETFTRGAPEYSGGGTVRLVTTDTVIWDEPPHKEEAGTPNVIGVIALAAAIKTIKKIGIHKIMELERRLTEYTLNGLHKIPGLQLYTSPLPGNAQIGVIPFNIVDIHHEAVAKMLAAEAGIAVRSGCFCAQPYVQKLLGISATELARHVKNPSLPRPGMVRISFGLYNNLQDIDTCLRTLANIAEKRISKSITRKSIGASLQNPEKLSLLKRTVVDRKL